MKTPRQLFIFSLAVFLVTGSAFTAAVDRDLEKAVASDHRSEAERARDQYRHPAETLAFFGVTPNQTVVEISPGKKGWYTAILAPLLAKDGKLYAAHWSANSQIDYFSRSRKAFDEKLAAQPEVYEKVTVTLLEPPAELSIAPNNSADTVLTFRNVHNWIKAGTAHEVFKAMYAALKPGGVLGIVEHRAKPGTPEGVMVESGYVTEARVIWLAKDAGFEFVGRSEINANPKDSADHPKGVWTLPPTLRLGEENRAHYQAIGESDRMTLKFRKPE